MTLGQKKRDEYILPIPSTSHRAIDHAAGKTGTTLVAYTYFRNVICIFSFICLLFLCLMICQAWF